MAFWGLHWLSQRLREASWLQLVRTGNIAQPQMGSSGDWAYSSSLGVVFCWPHGSCPLTCMAWYSARDEGTCVQISGALSLVAPASRDFHPTNPGCLCLLSLSSVCSGPWDCLYSPWAPHWALGLIGASRQKARPVGRSPCLLLLLWEPQSAACFLMSKTDASYILSDFLVKRRELVCYHLLH